MADATMKKNAIANEVIDSVDIARLPGEVYPSKLRIM
jgi:hypothetical protein